MSGVNAALGGPDVPGEATDKARALVAVLNQVHVTNLEDDGLPDGYSRGVHLILMQIDDLLAEDAAHIERLKGARR